MIFSRFQEQVRRDGCQPAVVGNGRVLTYGELEAAALSVARSLRSVCRLGDRRGPAVAGLLVEHGIDAIVAVLAALRAGVIYVPLDPSYPVGRLSYMLEHAGCDVVLTTGATAARAEAILREASCRPACVRIDAASETDAPLPEPPPAHAAAYILYTSGSSGRPKGVLQAQRSVAYFAEHWIRFTGLGPGDRVALVSSLAHDASVPDVFGALLSGATLAPYDVRGGTGLAGVAEWLEGARITMWHSVPTLYRRLAETIPAGRRFPDLRWIVLGGEAVGERDLQLTRRVFPESELAIIYGQSESTITSVWRRAEDGPRVSVGTPIGSTRVVLADEEGVIVEGIGTGEVVVCSDHVALGYWRDTSATEAAFTMDPSMGRLYWTGDLGRLAADGTITLAGRRDAQVKVRGHRVEPAEIEAVLLGHAAVAQAAVVARPGRGGDAELHAFVVPRAPAETSSLADVVAAHLPDYMAPRSFTMLDALPTLPTGKVDRAALAARPVAAEPQQNGAGTRTETEAKVAALWKRLLGVQHVGAESDFFDLGGHSLAILDLLAGVHDVFQTDLSFKDALQYRTVEQFARLIDGTRGRAARSVARAEEREAYPVSPMQKRLFLRARDGQPTLNMPVVVDVKGLLDRDLLRDAVTKLVARHEALRTSFDVVRGDPVQAVHGQAECAVEDLRAASDAEADRAVRAFVRPFELRQAPLARLGLVDRGGDRITLLLDSPAIVCDGTSRELLLRDLVGLYAQQDLPPVPLQQRDYAVWQQRLERSGALAEQERFWRRQFEGPVPRLDLPTDFARPAMFSHAGARVDVAVPSDVAAALRSLAAARGATFFMAAVAAFTAVLHARSKVEDLVVGGSVGGRGDSGLAAAVGLFANEIAIRTKSRAALRFAEHLEEVRGAYVEALAHGDVPLDGLGEALGVPRDPSRSPLFDVGVVLEAVPPRAMDPAGLALTRRPAPVSFTGCDLSLVVTDDGSDVRFALEYATDLFRRETVAAMARQLSDVIRLVSSDPDVALGGIHLSHDGAEAVRRGGAGSGRAAGAGRSRWGAVRRAERREYYPASALQQAIYRKHLAAPGKYNRDPIAYELRGPFDAARFQRALDRLGARHALLRTSFHQIDGRIVQRVHADVRCAAEVETCAESDVHERLRAFVRSFRLDEPPLWRVKLLRVAPERSIAMFDIHHIAYDGDSIQTLVRELAAFYRGVDTLPPPRLEYADYAVWEERLVRGGLVEASLRYWRERLDGARYASLPHAGTPKQALGLEELVLGPDVERAMGAACAALRCTRLGLLMSAFLRVLARRADTDDPAVGLRTSTRTDPGLNTVVGPFLNKVVIRSRGARDLPFGAFVGEVQSALVGAIEHVVCPFEMVRRDIALHGGPQQGLPVLVNYEAIASGPRDVFGEGIDVRPLRLELPLTPDVVPYQLVFAVFDWPAGATLRVVYDRSCGTPETMREFLREVAGALSGNRDAPAPALAAAAPATHEWTPIH